MMSLGSKLGLASLGVWLAFVGCGKSSDNEASGASAGAGTAGTAGKLNGTQNETGGTELVVPPIYVAGAGGLPAQPAIDCGQAGGDDAGAGGTNSAGTNSAGTNSAEECASPPSVCADDGRRLVYYSSGVCVAGACRWTAETLYCQGGCTRGSCAPPTTEK